MTPIPVAASRPKLAARAIRLSDGQDWDFALPSARFKPVFACESGEEEPIEIVIAVEHSLDVRRRLNELVMAFEWGTELDLFETFLGLASSVLQESHGIDSETAAKLLEVAPDDFPGLILEVISAVRGEAVSPGSNSIESEP